MGHSQTDKAKSRQRILGVASERLRGEGLEGPGVAEIMQAAGLTHGGFYKHFGSRDELVAESLAATFDEQAAATREALATSDDPLGAFAARYTAAEHCAHPEQGCAVAALASEVARTDGPVRATYTERIAAYIQEVDALLATAGVEAGDDGARREEAVARYAMLVGGLILARAVDDPALREELLATVGERAAQR
ncbi:MAG: TetR/AcrR family transcriptional regulator [Solirubrobacteraceae bacterium]|nr:TetR/AcrR family transcriptional regulator [Solirubrobacteraceae bacterium]